MKKRRAKSESTRKTEQLWRVVARGRASGDRISRFSSREAEEHVCGVGFDKRRLDVHRSEKSSPGFA